MINFGKKAKTRRKHNFEKDFLVLPQEACRESFGIMELHDPEFFDFFLANPQCKNLIIPKNVEKWETVVLPTTCCVLNLLIFPTLKYLGNAFWQCWQFERNMGGRIYYTGTREEWEALLDSCPVRLEFTPYNVLVEFVDEETFELPEIDFHTARKYIPWEDDYGEVIREQIRYCTYSGNVTVPVSYTDQDGQKHAVSGVGMLSFAFNGGLKKVIIPPDIDWIGIDAFRECGSLTEVYICESDRPITIEAGAFYECANLEKVFIGRTAHIGEFAFFKKHGKKITVDAVQDLHDREFVSENAFS